MNLTIIQFGLKKNIKIIIIWSVIWALMSVMTLALFTSIKEQASQLEDLLSSYPESILEAFGTTATSLTTVEGFYSSQVLSLLLLAGGIFAVYLGVNSTGKEISDKSISFLLSRPIGRYTIYFSKMFVSILLLITTNLIIYAISIAGIPLFTEEAIPWNYFFSVCIVSVLFQLTFLTLGQGLSVIIGDGKSTAFGAALAIITLIIDAISGLDGVPAFVKYLTPYHYVDLTYITTDSAIKSPEFLFFVVSALLFASIGAFAFKKKDIEI
ncbi:MAG: ABC transporter permease subunit [Candidatus Dojkabacteria bacterium]